MFTFKKIALVAAAGLAAFSMSCSDDNGTDVGGSWTTPFGATYDGDKTIALAGAVAAAPEGNTIASVSATVGSVAFAANEIGGLIVAPGAVAVSFANTFVGVPASLCTVAGPKTLKVEVTVTFVSGDPLKDSKDVNVTCSGAAPVTIPIRTLQIGGGENSTLGSFVDLDGNVAYTSANAKLAANAPNINIVYTGGFKDVDEDPMDDAVWTAAIFSNAVVGGKGYAGVFTAVGNVISLEKAGATADQIAAANALLTGTATSVPESAIAPFAALFNENTVDTEAPATQGSVFIAKGNSGTYLVAVKAKTGTGTGATASITIATLKLF